MCQLFRNIALDGHGDKGTWVRVACPEGCTGEEAVTLLQAQVTVLQAITFRRSFSMSELELVLLNWPMTQPVIAALHALPQWRRVRFKECTWPLGLAAITQLGEHVPRSYKRWVFGGEYGSVDLTRNGEQSTPARAALLEGRGST